MDYQPSLDGFVSLLVLYPGQDGPEELLLDLRKRVFQPTMRGRWRKEEPLACALELSARVKGTLAYGVPHVLSSVPAASCHQRHGWSKLAMGTCRYLGRQGTPWYMSPFQLPRLKAVLDSRQPSSSQAMFPSHIHPFSLLRLYTNANPPRASFPFHTYLPVCHSRADPASSILTYGCARVAALRA